MRVILNTMFYLQAQREVEVTIKDDAPDEVVEKQKPNAENSISDEEEMEVDDSKPKCSNCGILCHVTHSTPKGNFCGTCHQVRLNFNFCVRFIFFMKNLNLDLTMHLKNGLQK